MNFSSFLRRVCVAVAVAVAGPLLGGGVSSVNAQTTTFAQFNEIAGGNDFSYTSNATTATFSASSQVKFTYQNLTLPTVLQGDQNATLTLMATTSRKAMGNSIDGFSERIETATLTITRNGGAAGVGNNGQTLLLRVDFTNALFGGEGGAGSLNDSSGGTNSVNFTSDFLSFSATTQRNLALSFSSITPNLSLNANNFFSDFVTAGTGTFASNPLPTVVPEGDARPALGFLVGVVGLWEMVRRFRRGWSVVEREG